MVRDGERWWREKVRGKERGKMVRDGGERR